MSFQVELVDSTPQYSSSSEVADFMRVIVTITATSKVNLQDVEDELVSVCNVVDSKLGAAGYKTPVTAESASVVKTAVKLLVAASVLERYILSTGPTPDRVSTADTWRRQAKDILEPIYKGDIVLEGAEREAGGFKRTAGVGNVGGETNFPYRQLDV